MNDVVIDVRDLSKVYRLGDNEVRALDNVNLMIQRGEFVAIIGASGSGKSTLMNILGCLDRASSGRYLFESVDVRDMKDDDLAAIRGGRIGFVFQSFNLLPRTSAIENVALPLSYASGGPARARDREEHSRAALAIMGLSGRERSTPGQLSGGQQQRVAIARSLINHPSVLLADEPTGNLDTKTSHEIMDLLRDLNRKQGVTVIVVTHELDIAAYTDRVITMRDGHIISDERNRAAPASSPTPGQLPPSNPQPALSSWGRPPFAFTTMVLDAAWRALVRNKMRSALTMLGIFIGVAALIAMVAVGQGANQAVRKQIESLGTNLLVVIPGTTTAGGARGGQGSASTLTVADAKAIQRESPSTAIVSYTMRQIGQVISGDQNWTTSIQGVTPSYLSTANWKIALGRGLEPEDDSNAGMICLLGQTVYHQLFAADESPLGATILIKGKPVQVIGVLAAKGQSNFGQDQDDVVMVPFTAAQTKILGVAAPSTSQSSLSAIYPVPPDPFGVTQRLTGYVNQVYVQAVDADHINSAIKEVTEILARRHHIRAGQPNNFSVRNLSQIAEAAEGSSQIMALLLAVVASISLLVGGIGIMNILLVSVTERTREIGLRMAIGARRIHVLLQFLVEAVFLSVVGGTAGILIGIVASRVISAVAHWPTLLSPPAIIGGFVFSAIIGIAFGFFPARKAARLDPIQALHFE